MYHYFMFKTETYLWSQENYEFSMLRNAQDIIRCGYLEVGQDTLSRINLQDAKKMIRHLQTICINGAYW
jgi:hypothetical protein